MHSLRLKIFLLFCALLLVVEAFTLGTLYASMREQVGRGVRQQLDVGRQVFLAQFESRRRHLSAYSRVIAKDFGLLSALHDDPRSLLVALNNHRNRVGADLAIITDTSGRVLADTGHVGNADATDDVDTSFSSVSLEADSVVERSLFLEHGAQTYQLVVAPLLAPNPVGRLYLGFVVDDELARQFESITALQVSFIARDNANAHVVASTLPQTLHARLAATITQNERQYAKLPLDDGSYIHLAVPLAEDSGDSMFALLMQSEDAALAAYLPWWRQIAEVSMAVLLLGLAGAWAVARSVVKPVRLLADQADAIASGNYAERIAIRERGEIGDLIRAFNQMQAAISDREASIRYNAYHDPLTGLVNRYRLEQIVDERIAETAASGTRLGVLVLDLDRFKDINETLGYHAGDRLLRDVGMRLEDLIGDSGVVARLGGDEFGVLLSNVSVGAINEQLESLHAALRQPYHADDLALHISAGIGTAVFPEHGGDATTLLRHADAARFVAKEKRLRYAVYDGAQDRYSLLRVSLLGELQTAMDRGDLLLHYQPKLDLRDDAVREAEALLRWQHPSYGMIPPDEFIPMVERTGNIQLLTLWVIESALRQIAEWSRAGIALQVAVNISADDLRNPALAASVRDSLRRTGVPPEQLKLEITESAVVEDEKPVLDSLAQLHALGIALAIDDYGTGYSSLAQLKKLPVDEIKIDKSFVLGLDRNTDDEIIVRSTVELGHTMGLRVCAEGVESAAALRVLRKIGCELVQGYHIGRPMPAAQFAAWFHARGWVEAATKTT